MVETRETEGLTDYVVSALPFDVKVDPETMYGDGVNTPIGTYEFDGNEPGLVPEGTNDATRFLRGDGKWAKVVIPKQEQSDWDEIDRSSVAFIRNKPDIAGMIETAVAEETTRATAAETAARTEVRAGENATVDEETADDGHIIYTVNADGKPQVQSNWAQTDEGAVDFIRSKPGNFAGATAQAAGAYGFVPAPAAGDQEKFLCGNGTWANVDNTRECTALEMDSWIDEVEYG